MNPQSMQPWMRQMLIDKGVLSTQGLSRKAKVMRHKKCGILTLAGFDADSCAMDAWCDLAQLSTAGEVQALLAQRRTYELHFDRLNYRDSWAIKSRPASSSPAAVYAAHLCGSPIPAPWSIQIASPVQQPVQQPVQLEGVPF